MKKFAVALKLKFLNTFQLVELAKLIVSEMTANAAIFTAPDPLLSDLTTKANTLDQSEQDVILAKSVLAEKVAQRDQDKKALMLALTAEGRYVNNRAQGDKTIIDSSGMPASSPPGVVHLEKATGLSLSRGGNAGQVLADWSPVPKCKNYTVQVCFTAADEHGNQPWAFYSTSGKSSFMLANLTSATGVWVRVCANGTINGAFSEGVFIIVP